MVLYSILMLVFVLNLLTEGCGRSSSSSDSVSTSLVLVRFKGARSSFGVEYVIVRKRFRRGCSSSSLSQQTGLSSPNMLGLEFGADISAKGLRGVKYAWRGPPMRLPVFGDEEGAGGRLFCEDDMI